MLLIKNRGFNKSYVYGGSGIFDSISNAVASLLGREAIKRAATQAAQKVAMEAGKKLAEKGVQKISSLTSKSKEILNKRFKSPLTSQSQDILQKYTTPPTPPTPLEEEFNLDNLIMGSAIRIQDYIKHVKKIET